MMSPLSKRGCTARSVRSLVIIFLLSPAFVLYAEPSTRAELCIIQTGCTSIAEAHRTADFIEENGGAISVIVSPGCFIGWIPHDRVEAVSGNARIKRVFYQSVSQRDWSPFGNRERAALLFFNQMKSGETVRLATDDRTNELKQCIPEEEFSFTPENYIQNLRDQGLSLPSASANCFNENFSKRMVGRITSTLIFVESDGTIDEDIHTWEEQDQQKIISSAISGLNSWSVQARNFGINVTYVMVVYGLNEPEIVNQPYEPITRVLEANTATWNVDHLWINEIMANLGFSTGNKIDRVTAFNTFMNQQQGTLFAYTTFTLLDFSGGYAISLGGAYASIGNFSRDETFAHETGHIFHAFDEYRGAGRCSQSFNGVRNLNHHQSCEAGPCIMTVVNSPSPFLCEYTPSHVGWTNLAPKPVPALPSDGATVRDGEIEFSWLRNTTVGSIESYLEIRDRDSNALVYCESPGTFLPNVDFTTEMRTVDLPPGNYMWLVSNGGNSWNRVIGATHDLTVRDNVPETFTLIQNYPNPFNPSTTIDFFIPEASKVTLAVYNVVGQQVSILIDEEKPEGFHSVEFAATGLSSGIYYYTIEAGDRSITKKMLLLR